MNNFDNVDTYLEHFGKKGMRWGQKSNVTSAGFTKKSLASGYRNKDGQHVSRNAVRVQKNIDVLKRVESGKASKFDKYKASLTTTPIQLARAKGSLKKVAQKKVDKGAEFQKKSNAGNAPVRTALLKYGSRVRVSDLNFQSNG